MHACTQIAFAHWPFDEKMPRTGILEWLVEQPGEGSSFR